MTLSETWDPCIKGSFYEKQIDRMKNNFFLLYCFQNLGLIEYDISHREGGKPLSQAIPSSRVGVKINEWYKMIRQFSVPDAEVLKAEVEQDIQQMEEDQDLLIYYSLMCFRHQLMLDYLEPGQTYGNRPTVTELLETIETPQKKLTGLLKYYSLFSAACMNLTKRIC